jgi:hypothetical protein
MRTIVFVACIVSASLFLPTQAVAAGATVTVDLAFISGGGELEGGTTVGVSALSYVVGARVGNNGSLVLDGVATDCTIESVLSDCSEATLLCEDVSYEVIPGVRGGFLGSLNGTPLTKGLIRLLCKHSPLQSR